MTKKAILIGINYTQDSYARLYGCINDVVSMKSVLIDAYGYREEDILVLRDDGYKDSEGIERNTELEEVLPTRENILKWLNKLGDESKSLNELWIHYSGHGTYVKDKNNEESDKNDEAIVPCDFRENGFIVDDELQQILNKINCKTIITMDCCHSGSSWDLQFKYPINNGRIYRNYDNNKYLRNRQVYMLAGSRDNQTAADYYNFESTQSMGGFTMNLIQSMRDLNHNYSILNLYRTVNKKLEEQGYSQRCLLSCSHYYPTLNISRSNGGSSSVRNITSNNTRQVNMRSMNFTKLVKK
jgi:hypothetical protein